MKTIRINYIGFWSNFNPRNNLFYNILSQRYQVEISEQPDFIFCSCLGKPFEYTRYNCVRIQYIGENMSPDFTAFDYAIGFDYINFQDRYIRYPLSIYKYSGEYSFRGGLSEEAARKILQNKQLFCNFVYGHKSNSQKREQLFDVLNAYKRVESAGTYMNNQPDGKNVFGATKAELLKKSKFTIAGESVIYPGFNTEKIKHAFENHSIPIYSGDPLIHKMYNPKCFISLNDFCSIKDLVDRVIEIDNNDKLYIEMMMEPITITENYCFTQYQLLKDFLFNIFEQSPENAFRRMTCFKSAEHETYLKEYSKFANSFEYKIWKKLRKP